MQIIKTKPRARGFNLVEAAIVLGVVGLVIGGIWVASAAVQSNLRKSEASKGLVQIVRNVRNLYYGQSPTATANITTQMISASALPSNFINGTAGIHPWNGAVTVSLAGTSTDQIDVQFVTIPRDACIELTSRNTNVASGLGLTQILINSTTVSTFPYLPTVAATDCVASNTVTWRFGLRG